MKAFLPIVEGANNLLLQEVESFCSIYKHKVDEIVRNDISLLSRFMSNNLVTLSEPEFHFFANFKHKDRDSLLKLDYQQFTQSSNDSIRLIRKNIFCTHVINELARSTIGGYCGFLPDQCFVAAENVQFVPKFRQNDTLTWRVKIIGPDMVKSSSGLDNNSNILYKFPIADFHLIVPKYDKKGNNFHIIEDQAIRNPLTKQRAYVKFFYLWNGTYEVVE